MTEPDDDDNQDDLPDFVDRFLGLPAEQQGSPDCQKTVAWLVAEVQRLAAEVERLAAVPDQALELAEQAIAQRDQQRRLLSAMRRAMVDRKNGKRDKIVIDVAKLLGFLRSTGADEKLRRRGAKKVFDLSTQRILIGWVDRQRDEKAKTRVTSKEAAARLAALELGPIAKRSQVSDHATRAATLEKRISEARSAIRQEPPRPAARNLMEAAAPGVSDAQMKEILKRLPGSSKGLHR